MWSAFADRKPWAAVVLVFVLGPAAVMFYLGRARAGLIYLIALFFFPPLALIGYPHSYIVAKRQNGARPTAWHGKFYGLVIVFVVSIFTLGEGTRAFLWEAFESPSGSMNPTLVPGDRYYVSKFAYGYSRYSFPFAMVPFEGRIWEGPVERGDIAVFRKPPDNEIDYIKRIVGLPGDRIQVVDGILHINGESVVRQPMDDFVDEYGRKVLQYEETLPGGRRHLILETRGDKGVADNTAEITLPKGYYFMMGDNRDNSADSRVFGPVPLDNLVGRLSVVFWQDQGWRLTWSTPD